MDNQPYWRSGWSRSSSPMLLFMLSKVRATASHIPALALVEGSALENQKMRFITKLIEIGTCDVAPCHRKLLWPHGVGLLQVNGSLGENTRSGSGRHTKVLSVTSRGLSASASCWSAAWRLAYGQFSYSFSDDACMPAACLPACLPAYRYMLACRACFVCCARVGQYFDHACPTRPAQSEEESEEQKEESEL